MIFSQKTVQTVTLLFVLLMCTILLPPPGMHLELCLGKDGHVDFSWRGCPDKAKPQGSCKERGSAYGMAHHAECLDVTVACTAAQQLLRSDRKSQGRSHSSKKNPSESALPISESLADSADGFPRRDLYRDNVEEPFFPRAFLRTVVLLI